ncbi:MAG: RidA family protein [Candidatus Dadabacteria bacterium]|nr:RidA family protein [Candidatus Dadabacteria bacterium]NIS10163.1 RidA family protein [Candidatus Dadabacteria bacterium]NIV42553.1 RidA family protein [Candidatus Dadabacteria bacterium]NIY23075.1 RidA family protein [Candidatus Dadabacteria bacterium]
MAKTTDIADRLKKLNIEIPKPVVPLGSYAPAVKTGNYVYVSGQLPMHDGKLVYKGRLGSEISLEQGYEAARLSAINALSAITTVIDDLGSIKKILKLTGYVMSAPDFFDQPKVINGASELLFDIFGDIGVHARSAVGVSNLPLQSCVELDLVSEI